jgi:hypothetical protein
MAGEEADWREQIAKWGWKRKRQREPARALGGAAHGAPYILSSLWRCLSEALTVVMRAETVPLSEDLRVSGV